MSWFRFPALAQSAADAEQKLASANTAFGFRLLKELSQSNPEANVFISPYSISSVLQMVSVGARGQTEKELRKVLGTGGLSGADLNAAYLQLTQSIRSQTNVVLNIANALWYRAGAQLKPEFADVNQKFYGATLSALDFAAPGTPDVMNHWASSNTHGKIQTIISPPIPADTMMVLANAVYFKGTWLNPFDPKQTTPEPFYQAGGGQQTVSMMQQTRSFFYQESDQYQAVQLPYVGEELVMQILLPRTNTSLPAVVGQLDSTFWQKTFLPAFKQRKGTLNLPRFRLRYGADLKQPLAALGLKTALSSAADFSAMSSSRLFLSEIKHQSFVEVNEQGTEAAAVTTGVMALAAFHNEPPPFQMVVDRPFLFAISDQKTRSVLFLALVSKPAGA